MSSADIQRDITSLRSNLIQIIGQLNTILRDKKKGVRSTEYTLLKDQYNFIKVQIEQLERW